MMIMRFFFIVLLCSTRVVAEEYNFGEFTFYGTGGQQHHEPDEALKHEHSEEMEGGGGDKDHEKEHHPHHASHSQTVVTTNTTITSVAQQTGGVPLSLMQEAGLIKTPQLPTINKPKVTDSAYRSKITPVAADLLSLGIDEGMEVEEDPVAHFFTVDIWNDSLFHKSLLEEYGSYFDKEMKHLKLLRTEHKQERKERTAKVNSTSIFKEALASFQESNNGIQLQNRLGSYGAVITRFIKAQKVSSKKEKIDKIPTNIEVRTFGNPDQVIFIGDEIACHVLTYEGDTQESVYIAERDIRLLFGERRQDWKGLTLLIPYKSVLDIFNDKNHLFSLSLLRRKYRVLSAKTETSKDKNNRNASQK